MDPMEILLKQKRDEAAMEAMSSGLRRQKDVSNIAMLSGDRLLGNFGQGLAGDVDTQLKLKMVSDEKATQRDMTQGYYDQMGAHQGNVLKETIKHNRAMEEAARIKQAEAMTASDKALIRGVTDLSKRLEKAQIPDLRAGVSAIDEELAPYIQAGGELPGIGYLSNVGPAFTKDGRRMQARVAKIRNMILKARSGGAVTPSEADRLLQEFALGAFNSDEEFLASWADFKDSLAQGERNIYAGYDPIIVDQYEMNVRSLDSQAPAPSAPGAPSAPSSGAMDWADRKR